MIWVYFVLFALTFVALSVLTLLAEDEGWEGAGEFDPFWIFFLSVFWPIVLPIVVLSVLAMMIKVAIKEFF